MGRRVVLAVVAGIAVLLLLLDPPGGESDGPVPPERTNLPGAEPDEPGVAGPESGEDGTAAVPPAESGGPRRVPVEVAVVDAETGEAIPSARPSWIHRKKEPRPLAPAGNFFSRPDLSLAVRSSVLLKFAVELPPTHALENQDGYRAGGTVSLYADRVRVTIPAWPVATILVRVLDHEGNPAAGAVVDEVRLAGRVRKFAAEPTDGKGWTRVRGLPAVPGAEVRLRACGPDRNVLAGGRIERSAVPVRIVARLPAGASGAFFGMGGRSGRVFGPEGGGGRIKRDLSEGSVTIVVRHRNGRPAADTTVEVVADGRTFTGRTDGSGAVTLRGVPADRATVAVTEPGFVMGAPREVEIPAGQTEYVEIEEAPERWVRGVVRDRKGRALPGVSVSVRPASGGNLVWLHRGLQRLNVLTGADGGFDFPNVPPGEAVVRIDHGGTWALCPAAKAGTTDVEFPLD